MARKKATGVFVVTPIQFEESEPVQGIAFATASQANDFTTKLLRTIKRLAGKAKGLSKEEIKELKVSFGMDILMQPTDEYGNPVGDPALFDTVGLLQEGSEDESEDEESTEDEDDE